MELQDVFRHAGVPDEDIEVEMFNPWRMKLNISHVFLVEQNFMNQVTAVESTIINDVAALCGQYGSTIAFHLRSQINGNPSNKKPTLFVSFFEGATLDFNTIESNLKETLRRHNLPLELELLRGSVEINTMPSSNGRTSPAC